MTDVFSSAGAVELDHLVIVAHDLVQGVQWCEAVLGITPGPGGAHHKMGTHNRLFSIAGPHAPGVYAEILAIDPAASPPLRRRWFGLDEPALQTAVAEQPRLVHAVVRTATLDNDLSNWRRLGLDPGSAVAMSRLTPAGTLNWRLTVRDSGQLECDGCLPTLIEWPERSPGFHLPPSGVELLELKLLAPGNSPLPAAYAAIAWSGVGVEASNHDAGHGWHATFSTPIGLVSLPSFYPI